MDVPVSSLQRVFRPGAVVSREESLSRWKVRGFIGICLLGAFVVRLVGVTTRTFWQDEGLTLYQIQLSLPAILSGGIEVQGVMTQNTHPPLYFLLLGLFGRLAGYGQFAVRWFSIAWSLLTIPILYVFGRRVGGYRAGLIAALLAATSPLYLWYAQEVRMYSMVVCLSALSGYALWRVLTERRRHLFLGYALATAALLWTHYSVLFLVAVQGVFLLFIVGRRRPRAMVALGAGLTIAVVPFVPFIWRRLRSGAERDFNFVGLDTIARDLLHSFTAGVTMQIEGVWYFDLVILAVVLGGGVWLWRRHRHVASVLVPALLFIPPLLLYTASHIKPMYQNVRHLIVISPYFYLLAAAGLAGLGCWRPNRMPLGPAAVGVIAVAWSLFIGAGTVNYFTDPSYQKDDTRSMFAYIAKHFHPGDLVVLNDAILSHLLMYEQPQLPWTALPNYGTHANTPEARRQFEETLASAERIWFIYSPGDSLYDPDRRIKQWFRSEADLLEDRKFRGRTIGLAVAYYDPHDAIAKQPHEITTRLDAQFADGIDLYGAYVHRRDVVAGQSWFFDLVWHVRTQPTADYKVSVRLRGPDGRLWATNDQFPFPSIHPTSHWIPGDYLRTPHQLDVPPGTPPGTYDVVVELYNAATGERLSHRDGGRTVSLGSITVRPGKMPDDWSLPQPRSVAIGNLLQLHGADVPATTTVGKTIVTQLFVTVQRTTTTLPRVRLSLVDRNGGIAIQTEGRLVSAGGESPLPAGTLLGSRLALTIPPTLTPGVYRVRASFLVSSETPLLVTQWWGLRRARSIALGRIQVEDRPRRFKVPAEVLSTTEPIGAEWAQGIHLARVGVPTRPEGVQAGTTVPLTFVWRAGAPKGRVDRDYKVFVHLRNAANETVAQADAYPAAGAAPTNTWAEGEVIVDTHTLSVPADVPPGRYRLIIGFYEEASGIRLPLVSLDGNEYPLASLTVEAP